MEDENIHNVLKHIKRLLKMAHVFVLKSNLSRQGLDIKFYLDVRDDFDEEYVSRSDWKDFVVDHDDLSNVIDELTRPRPLGLTTVRIFETGGTGETTLAEKVFHLPTVVNQFQFCAWVNGKSSPDKVLSHILHSIAQSSEGIHGQSTEDKGEYLYKSLNRRKYLIILDGLDNCEVWDAIQRYFPDDEVGSRILLSSSVLNLESSSKSSPEHEDTVVGLDDDMSKIIDELKRPPQRLSIVTIAGMGGIGKTTLAKKVCRHPNVVYHFHCLAWVNTVASIDQVLSHLLPKIASLPEKNQGQSIEDKGQLLYRSLKRIRYLIVVDDLWNFDVWDAVNRYFPDDKVGSRILITTRSMEFITTTNIPTNTPHCMRPLDKHQSWELLEKLVFAGKSCPNELVTVGKQIAEGFGGLALAIVVISGILRSIPGSFISWWSIMRDVTSIVPADPERCLDRLALSYNYLPHRLKACLLYMGAFPAYFKVGVKHLLNLWIANGFLDSKSTNPSETEAEKYLKDLIGINLVCVGKRSLDGKVKTCFIHPLVRQLCLREARKENFMHVLEAGASAQDLEKQRHLVFNLDNLDEFQLLPPLPHLRSCIWLNLGSDFTPDLVLLQLSVFKWLRVLDIYFLPFDTFPLVLLNLVNLRYLALNVTCELDARILSQFSKLQTLVVYGPWVPEKTDANPILFLEFWKMPWLRNVYVKVPCCLRYSVLDVPHPPSDVRSFSTLTFSSCTREVFFLMPNLKKLGVSETIEDFENDVLVKNFHNLSFLNELQTLKCSFHKGNSDRARSLGWDVLPVNLTKLTLKGSHLSWDQMKFLALLPRLETLKLKDFAFQGPEWVVTTEEEVVFGCLKQLLIDNMDLVKWEVESTDHFPCLERLVLRSCKFLEKIPHGVGELSVLQVLELFNCSESAKDSAREFEEQYGIPMVIIWSTSK